MGPKAKPGANAELDKVLQYINQENRPFTAALLEQKMPSLTKAACQKILKALDDKGKIASKEFGKTLVYWKLQEKEELDEYGQPINGGKPTVEDIARQITSKKAEAESLANEYKQLQVESRKLESQPTDKEIEDEIKKLTEENKALQDKVNQYAKKKDVVMSESELKQLKENHAKARREWVKRKKTFKEVVDAVLERTGKKKADLKENIGWEDDEDLGVKMIEDRSKPDRDVKKVKR
ncbi:homologous-pairing protein 2 [Cavenderia fasciculata]|uniref:Homologous-pairing protein 2 homolog n=1 Tax=Cavenderia fasciculata TaxID=261658 RepID=F4PUT1_CACFS|nr:homologous-pairing protein 2 [Cavenderia fasciculata]EGG21100.1 homologous-pairing protein 2 [Cavenderia fasciculata]|eukprot:XP_004358950.1 homologous-pairing protein 2 [Cavenderia fasciculata]